MQPMHFCCLLEALLHENQSRKEKFLPISINVPVYGCWNGSLRSTGSGLMFWVIKTNPLETRYSWHLLLDRLGYK